VKPVRNLTISPHENTLPAWISVALSLLAWSAKRAPLAAADVAALTHAAQPVISTLKQKKIDSLFYISCDVKSTDQEIYEQVWSIQKRTMLSIVRCFADEDIEFYLFKGSECCERWYKSRPIGIFNDVDILVHRHDIGKVKAILYQNNFRQARFEASQSQLVDRDVAEVGAIEAQHYELAPFIKMVPLDLDLNKFDPVPSWIEFPIVEINGQWMLAVELDIHHGVATDIEIEDVITDAKLSSFELGLSLSDSNQVWVLISRYYTEVSLFEKRSLRDFNYVLPILASGNVDWDNILRNSSKYELGPALFYFFSFMDHLAGNVVPAEVLSELSPLKTARMRDSGWQLGKLFDFVEPFPLNMLETKQWATNIH